MGDPRKHRRKYQGPRHPWKKARIVEEVELSREYGLRRKKEIYKIVSMLKNFKKIAKRLLATSGKQADLEKDQLMNRLDTLGILKKDASLDAVLDLTIKDILERRLQTIVLRKQLARSAKQARQFITHKHITVNGKVITVPSYLVKRDEEASIGFRETSSLASEEHPERRIEQKQKTKDHKKKGKEEEEKETPLIIDEKEIKEIENEI